MIEAIVLSTFVHGSATHYPGDTAEFSRLTFEELAGRGLVRDKASEPESPPARTTRAARTPSNKKAPEPDNKSAPPPEAATATTGTDPDAQSPAADA